MGNLVDIANDLVVYLNAGTFSESFTAAVSLLPEEDMKTATALSVFVVFREGIMPERITRADVRHKYVLDVLLVKPIDITDLSEGLDFINLVESIETYVYNRDLPNIKDAFCLETLIDPVYSQVDYESNQQMVGVVTCTYQIVSEG